MILPRRHCKLSCADDQKTGIGSTFLKFTNDSAKRRCHWFRSIYWLPHLFTNGELSAKRNPNILHTILLASSRTMCWFVISNMISVLFQSCESLYSPFSIWGEDPSRFHLIEMYLHMLVIIIIFLKYSTAQAA